MKELEIILEYKKFFLQGIGYTLLISLLSIFLGVIIGMLLALMKLSNYKIVKGIATVYVDLLRGTPLFIQILIVYVSMSEDTSAFTAGLIALAMNSSAYVSEIIRAGINSIDKGQSEAARSLGFNKVETMKLIILPQALKNIVPVLGNEFIAIVKETTLVSIIGVPELMHNTDLVRGNSYNDKAPLLVAFAVYFALTFVLARIVGYMERRMKVSDRVG